MTGRTPGRPPEGVSAAVLLDGLGVFEAAARGYGGDSAVRPVRRVLRGMSDDQVRNAAAVLAVEGVWNLPAMPPRQRTGLLSADEVLARQVQVREWVRRMRLEAQWLLS